MPEQQPMSVPEQVALLDVRDCVACRSLRADVERVLDVDDQAALHALRRWQCHKDDRHPLIAAYLAAGDGHA